MKIPRDELDILIARMGELARQEAKRNGTYIVYQNKQGQLVREHADGRIVVVKTKGDLPNG